MRRYSKVGKDTVNAILVALMEDMVVYPSEVAADQCQTRVVDAVSDCISSILPVVDNLERASAAGGDAEQVRQGLEMIAKAAEAMLAKLGVTVFGEKGDLFDPELHNAVMHIEDETLGENVIVDVYQKGYRRGDRIIRHAMVRVAN